MAEWYLGFDIGGTRLKAAVVSPDGEVRDASVVETARQGFDTVLATMTAIGHEHVSAQGAAPRAVGVAAPGIVDADFGCRHLPGKVLGIEDFPLCRTLADEFTAPVKCANDGVAAVLAEWRFGAAQGHDDVAGVTLGTGIGSGVILNGTPMTSGHLGTGACLGHLTIRSDGQRCLCGNRGCAETLVSASAVTGRLLDALTRSVPSVLSETYNRDPNSISFRSLIEGVERDDDLCTEIMADFRRDLGAHVVSIVHAVNPSVVVIAGGPVEAADHFLPHVQAYVDRHAFVFPKDRRVPVLPARHSHHAGVLGAVALAMSALEDEPSTV